MWTVERIADYLGDWGISVYETGGQFKFHKPPAMSREQFEFIAECVKSHVSPQRDEFLAYVSRHPQAAAKNLPPAERRREVFRRLWARIAELAELLSWSGRIVWYSVYTLETGYLTADHKAFPLHATHADLSVDVPDWVRHGGAVTDQLGKVLVSGRDWSGRFVAFDRWKWVELPASRPPPKWREYPNFRPPADWVQPPGWADREWKRQQAIGRAERRAWFKRNWGSESLPPD